MATVTELTLICDICGSAKDVRTWKFCLDGNAYQIDLCPKDGIALGRIAGRYITKARKVRGRSGHRQAQPPRRGGPRLQTTAASSRDGAKALEQRKGVYVYGILPADIEVAAGGYRGSASILALCATSASTAWPP